MNGRTSEYQKTRTDKLVVHGEASRACGPDKPGSLSLTLINVMYAFTGIRIPQPPTTSQHNRPLLYYHYNA